MNEQKEKRIKIGAVLIVFISMIFMVIYMYHGKSEFVDRDALFDKGQTFSCLQHGEFVFVGKRHGFIRRISKPGYAYKVIKGIAIDIDFSNCEIYKD